jgi:alanine transaminase
VPYLRQLIATAMERRDGFPCDPEDLYMTDGASVAVHYMMEMLIKERSDGFMVPIPQYPLYSATLALYGGQLVPYMLDESQGWGLGVGHLRQQLAEARAAGTNVRGMVVINPGNPTGQCLSKANMEDIIAFCRDEGLVLIADEVYQVGGRARCEACDCCRLMGRCCVSGAWAMHAMHAYMAQAPGAQ